MCKLSTSSFYQRILEVTEYSTLNRIGEKSIDMIVSALKRNGFDTAHLESMLGSGTSIYADG